MTDALTNESPTVINMKFVRKKLPSRIRQCFNLTTLAVCTGVIGISGYSDVSFASGGLTPVQVGSELYFPMAFGDGPSKSQLAALGREIFFDKSLSASGKTSCATCHSPDHAYGAPNALPVQLGGSDMQRMGFRNAPSLTYLNSPIKFTEHFFEPEVTGGQDDEGPTGGRTWDGRVNTGHEQALIPLLDENEMANGSLAEVVQKVSHSSYAEEFRQLFSSAGENVFDNPDAVMGWLTVAIEAFEQSPADFYPYTSKYDAYLRDQAQLSKREKHGLELFNDSKKGNCASCHTSSQKTPNSHLPMLTDFGYVATGAPRNGSITANANASFYDLGLCGPSRTDLKNRPEYCGLFRTPTLRNVAKRKSYFHNGVFHTLKEVLQFYVTRDITPEKWYPRDSDGKVAKYNDMPAQYHKNVNADAPFAPLPGNKARLTPQEIDDVIAFLNTLSDGYVPDPASKK